MSETIEYWKARAERAEAKLGRVAERAHVLAFRASCLADSADVVAKESRVGGPVTARMELNVDQLRMALDAYRAEEETR
jgi:hypothetical protein